MGSDAIVVRRRKIPGVLKGDPWVYPNAVHEAPEVAGFFPVRLDDGTHLGWADYNPVAPIRARLIHRGVEYPGDETLIAERLHHSINRRLRMGHQIQGGAFRMVNGEGDGLPGLVIDLIGRNIVIDFYTAGMRGRQPLIESVLGAGLGDCAIHARMGADAAKREAVAPLEPATTTVDFAENGVVYRLALGSDQKSGCYLDQRDNRRLVAGWAGERKVLDLFCYHGAFALGCMAARASSALAIDASTAAVSTALANAERNDLALRALAMDVFQGLESLADEGPFDLVICDPPKLAPRKRDRDRALKAYRYLIDRCLRLLPVGGVLFIANCSQAIEVEDLRRILEQQGKKAGQYLDVVAVTGHPADHPWPVSFTTGRYLSAIAVERRGEW